MICPVSRNEEFRLHGIRRRFRRALARVTMTIERPLKIAGRIAVRELLSLAHSQQMTKRIPLVYSMSGRNSKSSGSLGSAQARYSAISLKRLLGPAGASRDAKSIVAFI